MKRQRWETFASNAEAKKRKAQIEYQQSTGTFIAPTAKTIRELLEEYIAMTGRQVFLEYSVIENVNSRPEHIRKLADWIYSIKDNYLLHVNLIACNLGRGEKTSDHVVKDFAAGLKAMGIGVTIRKSMGNDILAACGQLVSQRK